MNVSPLIVVPRSNLIIEDVDYSVYRLNAHFRKDINGNNSSNGDGYCNFTDDKLQLHIFCMGEGHHFSIGNDSSAAWPPGWDQLTQITPAIGKAGAGPVY